MRVLAAALALSALVACGRSPAAPVPRAAGEPQSAGPSDLPASPESGAVAPIWATPFPEDGFTRLGPAAPGSWRQRFPDETVMSFDEYVANDPVRAEAGERVLALLPVGDFGDEERRTLETAAEFAALWFDLPARVLPPQPLPDEMYRRRTTPGGAQVRQYRTTWFLHTLLPPRRPDDAVVLLGVTMADLYPHPDWNYVFGEANLRLRVGVYSLARYFPSFWGEDPSPESGRTALLRTMKVLVHETGHTFGLEHCATWACAMNGSNSLPETDAQPLHLCPDCLRKLAWNRGFDVAERSRRIAAFLDERGFPSEARWNRERAAR